jgi:hypothetical protein
VRFSETRARGAMDVSRVAGTGWVPRFGPAAAYADYGDWVAGMAGGV